MTLKAFLSGCFFFTLDWLWQLVHHCSSLHTVTNLIGVLKCYTQKVQSDTFQVLPSFSLSMGSLPDGYVR